MKTPFRISVLILFISFLFAFSACDCIEGEGPVETEHRNQRGFDAIELEISANVYIKQADQFEIKIDAQQNILDILRTRIRGNTLVIDYEEMCVMNRSSIDIYISMPELSELNVDGSGDIVSDDVFGSDEIYMSISGSGSIDVEVEAEEVDLKISGSGDIIVSGRTVKLFTSTSGSGVIQANRLKADNVKVRISGSGSVKVYAIEYLETKISGSGSVYYNGDPRINSNINGSGRIRKIR